MHNASPAEHGFYTKKGFNIDYTRDLSTMHKEGSIAVRSAVHLPLKYEVSTKS